MTSSNQINIHTESIHFSIKQFDYTNYNIKVFFAY